MPFNANHPHFMTAVDILSAEQLLNRAREALKDDASIIAAGYLRGALHHLADAFQKLSRPNRCIWTNGSNARCLRDAGHKAEHEPQEIKPPQESYMAQQAKKRPEHYDLLPPAEQWEIDRKLGILDWDGLS